jgi:arabinose-5-phosphate isomerase
MLIGKKIPFANEDLKMKKALKILSTKKLGVLIIQNKTKKTIGIVTDGQIRRNNEKNIDIKKMKISEIMTKNPIGIDESSLAAKALALMNSKRITSLCVYDRKKKYKTIGILHIHNILQNNIS